MNDRQLEKKIQQDTADIRRDLNTLMTNSTSKISQGFEKIKGDANETLVDAAETVKKEVGHGLSQYNAKAQEFADKVPGGFGEKVARYPWVAISIALAIGFLLGGLLKPARPAHELYQI
jgi:ElaB/YqjD/DUF883 family membrane-anchored ribosome-binding protein